MYSAILIAASVLGQCAGGRCPSPTSGGFSFPVYQPAQPTYRVVQPQPARQPLTLNWINYNGLTFQAWGTKTADGQVEWNPDFPANSANMAAAVRASQPKPAVKAEPVPVVKKEVEQIPAKNFGISRDRIGKHYGYSGNVREYAAKAESGNGKMFLTVIGSKEDRAAVVRDWESAPEFSDLHDKVNFGEFDRGDWQVSDTLGYSANGKPTILIQQASGRVDYRAYDYSQGAKGVAQALRRADPNYHPEKDPGPHNAPGLDDNTHTLLILAGVGLLAFVLIKPRRAP